MSESCFFYVEYKDADPSKGKIRSLCMECGKGHKNTWYWDKGFGQFEIKCHKCEKIIHSVNNSDE